MKGRGDEPAGPWEDGVRSKSAQMRYRRRDSWFWYFLVACGCVGRMVGPGKSGELSSWVVGWRRTPRVQRWVWDDAGGGCSFVKDFQRVQFGAPLARWLALDSRDWSAYAVVRGGGARVRSDLGKAVAFGARALLSCELKCSSP